MLDDPGRTGDELLDLDQTTLRRIINSLEFAQRLAGLGAWEWDLAANRLWWSKEVFDIFGRDPAVPPDYDIFLDSVHPEDRARVDGIVRSSWASYDGHYDAEYRVLRPDGRVRHVHALGEVTRDEHGELETMLGTVLDVTGRVEAAGRERRRSEQLAAALRRVEAAAEAERRAVERERSFLGAITHELRTPLTVLEGAVETMAHVDLDDDTRAMLTEALVTHVARLGGLIDDLLLVSTGAGPGGRSSLTTVDLLEGIAARAGAHMEIRLAVADTATIVVDRRSVERSVHAMIDNAARYGGGGPVDVSVRVEGDDLVIEVDDRGPGIPAGIRSRVFEPFARGEVRIDYAPGAGIGLTLVRICAEEHGGWAEIEDRRGGGTTVRLRLCDVVAAKQQRQVSVPTRSGSSRP